MLDTVHLVGINVLAEKLNYESISGGIILPDQSVKLEKGLVVKKGPGFLIPYPTENMSSLNELESIIGESAESKAKFIPLDIEIGDVIYYVKEAAYLP